MKVETLFLIDKNGTIFDHKHCNSLVARECLIKLNRERSREQENKLWVSEGQLKYIRAISDDVMKYEYFASQVYHSQNPNIPHGFHEKFNQNILNKLELSYSKEDVSDTLDVSDNPFFMSIDNAVNTIEESCRRYNYDMMVLFYKKNSKGLAKVITSFFTRSKAPYIFRLILSLVNNMRPKNHAQEFYVSKN